MTADGPVLLIVAFQPITSESAALHAPVVELYEPPEAVQAVPLLVVPVGGVTVAVFVSGVGKLTPAACATSEIAIAASIGQARNLACTRPWLRSIIDLPNGTIGAMARE
jgi:hypothetical protein